MNRKIYRQVARKYGMSVSEVKREMQAAVTAAYQNPNAAVTDIPKKGDIPTPGEFITYVARRVHTQADTDSEKNV